MPKTFIAQNITSIQQIGFSVNDLGTLVGIEVLAEVNYGTFGKTERLNVYPLLTAAQKTAAQAFYTRVLALVTNEFVG